MHHAASVRCRRIASRFFAATAMAIALVFILMSPSRASAQSLTWDNNGPTNNWSTLAGDTNWLPGNVTWTNGSSAIFGGIGESVELASDVTVNSITFNSTGFNITDTDNNSVLTLGGPSTVTVTNLADIATISEALTVGSISKAGAGTLVLSGNNTFGGVAVTTGQVTVASNTALGATSSVTSGAQIVLNNGINVSSGTLSIAGSGVSNSTGALQANTNATATYGGTLNLDTGARVGAQSGGTLTLGGVIQNGVSNTLNVSSFGGTVVVSGVSNTYTGPTNVIRGILKIGAANALPAGTTLDVDTATATEDSTFDLNGFGQTVLAFQNSGAGSGTGGSFITNSGASAATLSMSTGTSTYSGVIQDGASAVAITKTGTGGSLTLSGLNTYTGITTVTGTGQIVVGSNTGLGSTTGGTTVAAGAQVVLNNGITVTGETITVTGNGNNNGGALQTASSATATWAGNIIVSGGNARLGGGVSGTLNINGVISEQSANSVLLFSRNNNATTVLNAVNTYTGDTQIFANAGTGAVLRIGVDNAINSASRLSVIATVATVSMTLDLNGHILTLRGLDTSANHTSGAVLSVVNNGVTPSVLTVGDATAANTDVFAGSLKDGTSGAGGLSLVKIGANNQTLIANQTYTGSTTVNGGTLQIGGAVSTLGASAALASTQIFVNAGTFSLNNVGASNNNRLADTTDITFKGGAFTYLGSDSVNSSETIRNLVLSGGYETVTATFGNAATSATLNANQITRASGGGVALVNGTNLGINNSATTSVARVILATTPTLIGGTAATGTGINSSVHNTQIVPYLLGEATSTTGGTGTATGTPDTFLTYDPGTGLRPLNPTDEFTNVTVNNFVAGDNTRIGAVTQTLPSSMALNSLILGGGTLAVGSNTLTLSSGAILFTAGSSITGGTLALGGTEGVFSALPGTSQISSKITGTAGLTLNGINGGLIAFGSAQSDYTGNTTLLGGTFVPQVSSIGPGGAPTSGPLGKSTLVLAGGAIRGTSVGAVTLANNVIWQVDTSVPTGGQDLTFTGSVTITGSSHTLTASTGSNTVFSGAIGDGGSNFGVTVNNTSTGSVIFNGANTYGGTTTVSKGILLINGTHTGGDTYTVASTATLGGTGTITTKANSSVNINSGGTLSVGSTSTTAGTLTIVSSGSGALTFASATSVLKMDLISDGSAGTGTDQSADPTRADKLAVTGSAVLNGAHFILSDPNSIGTTLSAGDRFDLFDWATAVPTGNFTINPAVDLPTLTSGLSWDLSDLYTGGTIAVAPEPSRALLLAFGLMVLGLRRRRR